MWERQDAIDIKQKPSWDFMDYLIWFLVYILDFNQVVYWADDFDVLRLVDGNY